MDRLYYIELFKGFRVVVNEDVYYAYYRPQWRELKIKRAKGKRNDCSYEFLCENSVKGNDEIVAQPFEDVVIDKILCESLRNALNKLSVEEYKLIYELYYQDMTERQVATAIGISQVAVHKRKNKILNKLKQLIGE